MKITMMAVTMFLALAFMGVSSQASEVSSLNKITVKDTVQKSFSPKMSMRTAEVMVIVSVPSSKLKFRHVMFVVPGTTVSQALEMVYNVEHGLVCCDSRDIWAINGLATDPYKEKWWVIKMNGNMQNTSSTSKLKDRDVVEFVYMENAYYPVAHVRLEEWVENAYENNK